MAVAALLTLTLALAAQAPEPDPELTRYVERMRARLDDPALPAAQRQELAIETAETLDRAARAAASPAARQARWSEAAALLDALAPSPDADPPPRPALQAAIYRWAIGRSWLDQHALAPADPEPRARAAAQLDQVAATLRSLAATSPTELAAETRYRLAQTLADRARLEPAAAPLRRALIDEALTAIDTTSDAPAALAPAAAALRAALRLDAGQPAAALDALDQTPGVDPLDTLPTRLQALGALGRSAEALALLASADLEPDDRIPLAVSVHLAARDQLDPAVRAAAETAALAAARPLVGRADPAARLALIALARALDPPVSPPDPEVAPTLAAGRVALGDLEGAATCLLDAAVDDASGDPLRFQAAAYLLRAGRLDRAIQAAEPVVDRDPPGPFAPRAALVRALAAEQAADQAPSPASLSAARAALERAVAIAPDDPSSHEARYRLGLRLAADAEDARALTLWNAVPRDHPRWVDARRQAIRLQRDRLETPGFTPGAPEIAALTSYLNETRGQAPDPAGAVEVELEQVRYELGPVVRDTVSARSRLDQLETGPLGKSQRDRIAACRAVLELARGRYSQAEDQADLVASESRSEAACLEAARLVDRLALLAPSDLARRRHGSVIVRLCAAPNAPPDWERDLLTARGHVHRGDTGQARQILERLGLNLGQLAPGRQAALAEALHLLGDHDLALNLERLLANRAAPGTATWFHARLRLATGYLAAGRPADAARLIEATTLLHPAPPDPFLALWIRQLEARLGLERPGQS